MTVKYKIIILVLMLALIAILGAAYVRSREQAVPPAVSVLIPAGVSPLAAPADTPTLPLSNGESLYFILPSAAAKDCTASGACGYDAYFGTSFISSERVYGFDGYKMDCSTEKKSFYKDPGDPGSGGSSVDDLFGSVKIDSAHDIVRVYDPTTAASGSENVYHIASDGLPTLIASYDDSCTPGVTETLFLDKGYSAALAAFQ